MVQGRGATSRTSRAPLPPFPGFGEPYGLDGNSVHDAQEGGLVRSRKCQDRPDLDFSTFFSPLAAGTRPTNSQGGGFRLVFVAYSVEDQHPISGPGTKSRPLQKNQARQGNPGSASVRIFIYTLRVTRHEWVWRGVGSCGSCHHGQARVVTHLADTLGLLIGLVHTTLPLSV